MCQFRSLQRSVAESLSFPHFKTHSPPPITAFPKIQGLVWGTPPVLRLLAEEGGLTGLEPSESLGLPSSGYECHSFPGFLWWFIQVPLSYPWEWPSRILSLQFYQRKIHAELWYETIFINSKRVTVSCPTSSALSLSSIPHATLIRLSHHFGLPLYLPFLSPFRNSPAFLRISSYTPTACTSLPLSILGSGLLWQPSLYLLPILPPFSSLIAPSWASPSAAAEVWISTTKKLPHVLKWSSCWTTADFPGQDFSLIFSGLLWSLSSCPDPPQMSRPVRNYSHGQSQRTSPQNFLIHQSGAKGTERVGESQPNEAGSRPLALKGSFTQNWRPGGREPSSPPLKQKPILQINT